MLNTAEQFVSPWTGGNPKLRFTRRRVAFQFVSPWTGGNPKPVLTVTDGWAKFVSPWTGGNPKRVGNVNGEPGEFVSPWTGGNPKLHRGRGAIPNHAAGGRVWRARTPGKSERSGDAPHSPTRRMLRIAPTGSVNGAYKSPY